MQVGVTREAGGGKTVPSRTGAGSRAVLAPSGQRRYYICSRLPRGLLWKTFKLLESRLFITHSWMGGNKKYLEWFVLDMQQNVIILIFSKDRKKTCKGGSTGEEYNQLRRKCHNIYKDYATSFSLTCFVKQEHTSLFSIKQKIWNEMTFVSGHKSHTTKLGVLKWPNITWRSIITFPSRHAK